MANAADPRPPAVEAPAASWPRAFDSPAAFWRWLMIGLGGLSVAIRTAHLEGPPMPAEQRQALRVQIGHLQKVLEEQDARAAQQ